MSPLPDSRQHLARRHRRPRDTPIWKLEAVLKCRALQRLRSLRKEAADEIDRLLAILDTIDDTDVDSQYDDDPIDDLEEEPSPGWTDTQAQSGRDSDYAGNREDDAGDNPQLAGWQKGRTVACVSATCHAFGRRRRCAARGSPVELLHRLSPSAKPSFRTGQANDRE
jgi:hypothetical protein